MTRLQISSEIKKKKKKKKEDNSNKLFCPMFEISVSQNK
jgi:hypothetical protein